MNPQAELGSELSDAARNLLLVQHLCCLFCVSQIEEGTEKLESIFPHLLFLCPASAAAVMYTSLL